MKRIWIIALALFGAASCAGVLVGGVFLLSLGLTEAADGFFLAVKRQDFAAARVYLSEDFRSHTSDQGLSDFLGSGPLAHCASTHWSHREIRNSFGQLDGEVQSDNGGVVPVTLTFVKEKGEWKIQSMSRAEAGVIRDLR